MRDFLSIAAVRQLAWRIGRRLYCWARRDIPNNPATNGEYWLIEQLIGGALENQTVLVDIGANRGDWTAKACEVLDRTGKTGLVYAFEPTASTYAFLSDRFGADDRVRMSRSALSDRTGEADFFVVGELAGTNSLHSTQGGVVEKVQTERFDDFVESRGLKRVLFVKCDTEGHDLSVLQGAERSLQAGAIDVWQFEYNHRWAANSSVLKHVFDLIDDKPYRLGKLYRGGIETYETWHPELDRFFEANYVLICSGSPIEKLCRPVRFNASNVLVS